MTDMPTAIATGSREKSIEYLEGLDPEIPIKVALCDTYSALLQGNHREPATYDHVLQWALQRGRVVVSGRGASGKTTLLHRLVVHAADNGMVPLLLNLSLWDHAATEEWPSASESTRVAFDFLLRRFSPFEWDLADLEFLPTQLEKVFLIDGLNETPGAVAEDILETCDRLASLMVGCSVIVSDRLARRSSVDEAQWNFVMPLPVETEEIDRLLKDAQVPPAARTLLDIPFFLDRALRGELRASPLSTIRELVEDRGQLDAAERQAAAQAAFRAYETDRSRTFPIERFTECDGEAAALKLQEGGILVAAGPGQVAFSHHWIHDYLASQYVADNPDLWSFENRHRVLDALTFKANSFDTIAFVLELLAHDTSESFLRAVYDWNPYASGYALAEAGEFTEVPQSVKLIVLAMLAEKRLDRHFYSAQKAADALDLFPDDIAADFKDVTNLDQLLELVRSLEAPTEEFATWQRYFASEPDSAAPPALIASLADDDSIMGWTAANVLKRLSLSDKQIGELVTLSEHEAPVIRWRACHVMGSKNEDRFVQSLLSRLVNDPNESVRYGAVRSLVEIASRDEAATNRIVEAFIDRLDAINHSNAVLGELSRSVFLSDSYAPPRWATNMSRVFYALMDRADEMPQIDHWSELTSQLRAHHGRDAGLVA